MAWLPPVPPAAPEVPAAPVLELLAAREPVVPVPAEPVPAAAPPEAASAESRSESEVISAESLGEPLPIGPPGANEPSVEGVAAFASPGWPVAVRFVAARLAWPAGLPIVPELATPVCCPKSVR